MISTRLAPYTIADELDGPIAQDRRDEALGLFYQRVLGMPSEALQQLGSGTAWAGRLESAHTIPGEMRAVEVTNRFNWNRAREIDQPTLLLQGELSIPVTRASSAALHALVPTSRLAVLHGQGHAALRTAPDMVTAHVAFAHCAFIRRAVARLLRNDGDRRVGADGGQPIRPIAQLNNLPRGFTPVSSSPVRPLFVAPPQVR